jgi:hypothetical protein
MAVLMVAAMVYLFRSSPAGSTPGVGAPSATPKRARFEAPPSAVPVVAVQPPVMTPRVIAAPPVQIPALPRRIALELATPIQDRATIDFSIGAPVVRSGGSDAEVLDKALRQMEEATKTISFPPSAAPTGSQAAPVPTSRP